MVLEQIVIPINEDIAYSPLARTISSLITISSQIKELEKHMAKYDCSVERSLDKINGFPREIILVAKNEKIDYFRMARAYNEFWEIINKRDKES